MHVVVFGASGKVGRLVVAQLLNGGHTVTVFVHKSSPFEPSDSLKIVRGDIYAAADVAAAVQGADVVMSALGSWGTKSKNVVSTGVAHIIPAMQLHGVRRLITLTGSDAVVPGERISLLTRLTRGLFLLTPARKILKDGDAHIAQLAHISLDWTVLRSPPMNTRGNATHFILTAKRPKPWMTIHRTAVAQAMVALATDEQSFRQAPFIARGASN